MTPPTTSTIDSLARHVVERQAPDEMPYYPNLRDDFFALGGRLPKEGDNPLGFGAVALGVVTGVVLAVLNDLVVGSLTDAVRPWWKKAWQRLLRRAPRVDAQAELPALSAHQVPLVREAVLRHGARADLREEQAAELADAIVSELMSRADDSPTAD
ncbi:hypothetical protein [Nocardiopsis sp. CA-288880]|uniref:hypothetical protein n=1 Tax=Nocardiopsis sp. CA-288880 TaxID=3239995 RepID=UPI003D961E67